MRASLLLILLCTAVRILGYPVNFTEGIQIAAFGENQLVLFTGSRVDIISSGAIKTNALALPSNAELFAIDTNVFYLSGRAIYQIDLTSKKTTQVVSHSEPLLLVGTHESSSIVREVREPGKIISFDLQNRTPIWRSEEFEETRNIIAENTLYAFERRQKDDAFDLIALDLKTGKKLWRVGNFTPNSGGLLESEKQLFVADKERLHVFDAESGRRLHSFADRKATGWLLLKSGTEEFCVMFQYRADPLLGRSSKHTAFRVDGRELAKLSELDVSLITVDGLSNGKALCRTGNTTRIVDLYTGKSLYKWPGTFKARFSDTIYTFSENQNRYSIHSCNLKSGEAKAIYEFATVR
ncbi:MAG TPA: PQQ-binding-like beta-propeller repeat protein [Verrucomicrobiae bacterium]